MIILLGAVAWVGWSWLGSETSRRDAAAAANCPGGTTTIQVATDPSIADTIGAESVRYTQSNPVVDDTCVKIRVTSINSAAAEYAFLHGWDTNKLGPKPQAWIPDSSLWVNQALAAQPTLAGDTTQSIATSPVVLAMSPDAGRAMQAGPPSWTQLPSLVAQANGWGTFGQAAWGAVTLDLPDPAHDSASLLALAEMIDPASPTGQPPISSQLLENTQTRQQIDTFASTQPNPAPTATRDALVALGRAAGVQTAPFTAVPTTEVALYQRNLGLDGASRASTVLDEVRVAGTTSVADFPFLPLAGDWVTSDQLTVAQHFRDFLRSAPEQAELSKAGLRSAEANGHPNPSPGMDWGLVSVAGTPTDNASYNLLVGAWNTAVTQSR